MTWHEPYLCWAGFHIWHPSTPDVEGHRPATLETCARNGCAATQRRPLCRQLSGMVGYPCYYLRGHLPPHRASKSTTTTETGRVVGTEEVTW